MHLLRLSENSGVSGVGCNPQITQIEARSAVCEGLGERHCKVTERTNLGRHEMTVCEGAPLTTDKTFRYGAKEKKDYLTQIYSASAIYSILCSYYMPSYDTIKLH